jgi:nickel-dependent lactate racemase
MLIQLPYGKKKLSLSLPDSYNICVIEPIFVPAISEPCAAIRKALQSPISLPTLSQLVKPDDRVGIVFSDVTRPTPNSLILPEILAEIAHIPPQNVILFDGLGTHRKNSSEELRTMLGDSIVDTHRIVQNDAFDPSTQVYLGETTYGHEIWLNRELMDCDFKILTGYIEPHFFAGFSGGGKAIMPGMAGLATILGNHSAKMIAHSKSTWGITQGNPIFEEISEIAGKIENTFLLNVTLNRDKEVTGVFGGKLPETHRMGCEFVKEHAMIPVPAPFDIVITTNSGFPLDMNLYQSVKGMSAAAKVVRKGGAIILAAECQDGIPDHGLYGRLLRSYPTPLELLEGIMLSADTQQDQWQVQIQALIQLKADIYVYSDGLTDDEIRSALLQPVRKMEKTIEDLVTELGRDARICILPEGPQTIPYVR